ncbi:enoyl-CoA hydratase/isomerase family protein [Streptomyces lonarensis]|uniref:Enoyl-CoA hydratase n=1 Tax=Streptomyces lonarensis TaxID=700599 RepID=A0A7X6CYP7_9ACTN|nr:enoyl-CoA hydratase-related protein [Streptomyces lonarensis]NJQ04838.1 enoyl-CoA hydratase [Streptomyces lonarensis]
MTGTTTPGGGPAEGGEPELVETLDGGVATLRLNRPARRNALSRGLAVLLVDALRRCGRDPEVRVVVLTGTAGAFCAGDELDERAESLAAVGPDTPVDPHTGDLLYLRICEQIVQLPKPVIAAVDGAAAGAGTEILCAADLRIASDRTRIGSCVVKVGHLGNAVMLPRVVGPARATEIYLSGRLVGAEEAARIGLVDHLVEQAEFPAAVAKLAGRLAAGPTATIGLYKELRERAAGVPVAQGLRLQDAYHLRTHLEVPDSAEGLAAYVAGRVPRFTGAGGPGAAPTADGGQP